MVDKRNFDSIIIAKVKKFWNNLTNRFPPNKIWRFNIVDIGIVIAVIFALSVAGRMGHFAWKLKHWPKTAVIPEPMTSMTTKEYNAERIAEKEKYKDIWTLRLMSAYRDIERLKQEANVYQGEIVRLNKELHKLEIKLRKYR